MSAFDPKRTYALQQAAAYSITSSARARMVAGIVRPSALAVLRLTTKSIWLGSAPADRSAFAPFSIRSTFVEFVVWYDK